MTDADKLPVWLYSSIAKHFETISGVTMFIEHQKIKLEDLTSYIEVRVDGPNTTNPSKDYYVVECPVNVLATAKYDYKDIYKLHRILGKVYAAFVSIDIYRYGDDNSLLGCLNLMPDKLLILSYLGEQSKDLYQGYVQGNYKMELEE